MARRWKGFARIAAVVCALVALPTVNVAQSNEPVHALAPTPAACDDNPSFCGITLRVDSDAGTIPSVAAGAHYGPAWGIPAADNNSTGVGWCVDDTHTGFPVGPIEEQALPPSWTPHDMRRAATIIALYGGDDVLPYQPLRVDGSGELAGTSSAGVSPTRHRQIAVWFALRSLLPDGAGTPRIDLGSATTFSDPGGQRPSVIGDSAVELARRLVAAADEMTASSQPSVTVTAADGQPPSTVGAAEQVTVHVADDAGNPLPNLPVWPSSSTNATVTLADGADDERSVAFLNAQDSSWPSLDSSGQLDGASVTDASGNATFSIEIDTPGTWQVEFDTATPPSTVHLFGDDINAQNNVSILADEFERASGSVTGEVVERFVRVVKTSSDPTFGVNGAVMALIDANDVEVARGTTDADGVIDFPPIDSSHPVPLAVREVTPPIGLALHSANIEVPYELSSNPTAPTVVDIENHPVLHELIIQKEVVGSPGFGPSLAGFNFSVTRNIDSLSFDTVSTDEAGRAPPLAIPAGEYSIRELDRPTRWPSDDPLPDPISVTVPTDAHEPITVTFENSLPPPSITTSASDPSDGDKYLRLDGGGVADTVTVCGVVEGTTYRVEGELMFVTSDTGTAEATDIRATAELVASPDDDGCQSIELDFDVPADTEWLGRPGHFVVTEGLFVESEQVATHDDLESIEQSMFVAKVRSQAVDGADGDGWIERSGGTVRETLLIADLDWSRPDVEIRADSMLMVVEPNGEVHPTGASGTATFTVGELEDDSSLPTVDIPYSAANLSESGGTGVVFTTISDAETGTVIAEHHDPTDVAQQVRWHPVSVEPPPTKPPPTESPPTPTPTADLPRTGSGSALSLQRWGSALALLGSLLFVASGTRRRRNPTH